MLKRFMLMCLAIPLTAVAPCQAQHKQKEGVQQAPLREWSAGGVLITCSVEDTGWKLRADLIIQNLGDHPVTIDPSTFRLELPEQKRYEDQFSLSPEELEKELRKKEKRYRTLMAIGAGLSGFGEGATTAEPVTGTIELLDSSGGYTGYRGEVEGSTIKFYDSSGNYVGRGEVNGKTVQLYDTSETFTGGHAEIDGDTLKLYDASGSDTGYHAHLKVRPDYEARTSAHSAVEQARNDVLSYRAEIMAQIRRIEETALPLTTLMPGQIVSGSVYFKRDKKFVEKVLRRGERAMGVLHMQMDGGPFVLIPVP